MILLIRPFYSQISDRPMEGLTGLSPWYKQLYLQKLIRYSFSGLQKLIKKQTRTFWKRPKANATGYCTNSWETLAIWSGHRDHFTPHKRSVAENNTPLQDTSQKEKTCAITMPTSDSNSTFPLMFLISYLNWPNLDMLSLKYTGQTGNNKKPRKS